MPFLLRIVVRQVMLLDVSIVGQGVVWCAVDANALWK